MEVDGSSLWGHEGGKGVYRHSLTPISGNHLLLVGGKNREGASLKMKIFNVEKEEWTDSDPLDRELSNHRAVVINGGTRNLPVACLGGVNSKGEREAVFVNILFS